MLPTVSLKIQPTRLKAGAEDEALQIKPSLAVQQATTQETMVTRLQVQREMEPIIFIPATRPA